MKRFESWSCDTRVRSDAEGEMQSITSLGGTCIWYLYFLYVCNASMDVVHHLGVEC
jgi:hypothetical protein